MTQNTQTTAERIETFLDSCLDRDWHEIDTHEAAQTIAAEIDALTAERDEARAKLKECDDSTDFVQELREAEQSTLANTQRLLGVAQTQIDAKDKRIAELEGLLREHEDATRDAVAVTLAGNALAGELAKALAEVERLRPAAEAWEAGVVLREAEYQWLRAGGWAEERKPVDAARENFDAARARAAKGQA